MPLKAKKPKAIQSRLKLFMYGDAGVGKTTAACQLPSPYIIDSERGTTHYHEMIEEVNGVVLHTISMSEVIEQVRLLRTEKHGYKTLVLDSISPLYFEEVERCEEEVGNEWGKHYAEANKSMKRLVNLLMDLDMNIIVTAHGKERWGDDNQRDGITFDGWKKLDYVFDLVLELRRTTPTKRKARVMKTRLESFPDGDSFEWSYDALVSRFSQKEIERSSKAVTVINKEQIDELTKLAEKLTDGKDFLDTQVRKAKISDISDLTQEQATAIITHFHKTLGIKEKE